MKNFQFTKFPIYISLLWSNKILKIGSIPLLAFLLFYLCGCEPQVENNKSEYLPPSASPRSIPCGLIDNDCDFTFSTFISNIPIIIGQCTVLVNYTLEVCYDANNIAKRIAISNLTWIWSSGCDSIRSSWSNLYANGFYSSLNVDMNTFYNSLSIQV